MSLLTRINDLIAVLATDIKTLLARGIPAGGITGQMLSKLSNTSYALGWITPSEVITVVKQEEEINPVFTFNPFGQLTQITYQSGSTKSFSYRPDSKLIQLDYVVKDLGTRRWSKSKSHLSAIITNSTGSNRNSIVEVTNKIAVSEFVMSTGKWYWEMYSIGPNDPYSMMGIIQDGANLNDYLGSITSGGIGFYGFTGNIYNGTGTITPYGTTFGEYTWIRFAFDADAKTLEIFINGNSQGLVPVPIVGSKFRAAVSCGDVTPLKFYANFGQTGFNYVEPSGYAAAGILAGVDVTQRSVFTYDPVTGTLLNIENSII